MLNGKIFKTGFIEAECGFWRRSVTVGCGVVNSIVRFTRAVPEVPMRPRKLLFWLDSRLPSLRSFSVRCIVQGFVALLSAT